MRKRPDRSSGHGSAGQGSQGFTRRTALAALALTATARTARAASPAHTPALVPADPLPSWRSGGARDAILRFIAAVTAEHGPDFVPISERIAVFDDGGTLWTEQPACPQLLFAIDRVRALAPRHPEWKQKAAFRAALKGDLARLVAGGDRVVLDLIEACHGGISPDEFQRIVAEWLAVAHDARFGRAFTELVYQPMVELIALLRGRGFKTFIISAGSAEFIRAFSEPVCGVPPEQVVGSTSRMVFEMHGGGAALKRLAAADALDDGPGKPVGIARFIGRRPIAAFGNADDDLQMLHYVRQGPGQCLCVLVHHDDDAREYAYDRQGRVGKLAHALDIAPDAGWTVASMRADWNRVFSFDGSPPPPPVAEIQPLPDSPPPQPQRQSRLMRGHAADVPTD